MASEPHAILWHRFQGPAEIAMKLGIEISMIRVRAAIRLEYPHRRAVPTPWALCSAQVQPAMLLYSWFIGARTPVSP